jgi:hypothetical protein
VFAEFLRVQNGAILFSGSLSIYGVLEPGQRISREPMLRPPFNIEDENASWPPHEPDRLLAIGGYGFDGSSICIDRRDFGIALFQRGEALLRREPTLSWDSLDQWLRSEISRLSNLFDTSGRMLVEESQTVPTYLTH